MHCRLWRRQVFWCCCCSSCTYIRLVERIVGHNHLLRSRSKLTSIWLEGREQEQATKEQGELILKNSKATDACLSDIEIEVLKSSSRINGLLFMPWLDGEERTRAFDLIMSGKTCGLASSRIQTSRGRCCLSTSSGILRVWQSEYAFHSMARSKLYCTRLCGRLQLCVQSHYRIDV